jgi:threonine dehydratase
MTQLIQPIQRLSLASIEQAMTTIPAAFLNSPQFVSEPLSDLLGCRLVVKIETLNPIRSFKGRGASHFVAGFANKAPLICASAGNFGQAMAYACRIHGRVLAVYASVNANPLKIARMRALGATVVLAGEDFDAAKLTAKAIAATTGAYMVEDGQEVLISEGAGTMALELLQMPMPLDAVLIPLGNGAMLGGMAVWLKNHAANTKVIAVQAAGAPAMLESWQQGRLIEHNSINTIADGIGVRVPIQAALNDMQGTVDDGLLVSEAAILAAMKLAHQHLGLVLEPSGAVGLAALWQARERFAGQTVATVLCGGNLTPEQMGMWL